jgi:SAM-dependent methyltransferase
LEWRRYQENLAEESDHWGTRRYRSLARNVARHLPVTEGRCLDAGCGEGLISFAVNAHRPAVRLYGTDISATRLARAASRVTTSRFVAGDLLMLPWKDGAFDAVVCCEVLEHLPDPGAAVEELYRIVRDGGMVLITVPDRQKLKWSICPECGTRVYKDGHIHSFTPDDVRGLLEPRGEVIKIVPIGKLWRMIRRRLTAWLPGRKYKGRYLLGAARKRAGDPS